MNTQEHQEGHQSRAESEWPGTPESKATSSRYVGPTQFSNDLADWLLACYEQQEDAEEKDTHQTDHPDLTNWILANHNLLDDTEEEHAEKELMSSFMRQL